MYWLHHSYSVEEDQESNNSLFLFLFFLSKDLRIGKNMKLRSIIKRKKGIALNQAFAAVLTLVLIGVLVIIGIVLFVSLVSGPFANVSSVTIVGESLTPSGNGSAVTAGTSVSNSTRCSFNNFNLVIATNTSGQTIDAANYTTTSLGVVSNTTVLNTAVAAPWVLNYTYTWGSEACTASQDMITQFATYPVLVGLVGTIIFLGLVIGVLVASFVFGRREAI